MYLPFESRAIFQYSIQVLGYIGHLNALLSSVNSSSIPSIDVHLALTFYLISIMDFRMWLFGFFSDSIE